MSIDKYNFPEDIKNLDIPQAEKLSRDIRESIISTIKKNGGHLSSNLGIVDLTIAIHMCFNSPEDKIIFDTSHQCYTHKILTGRNKDFTTINQFNGLSGFSNPNESEHDHFINGHLGTALSQSLGLAHARDLENKDNYIISVIGDASLTNGLTLEALNNCSQYNKLIIILNDNEMAISENVGSISKLLSKLLNNPKSYKLLQDFKKAISKIPNIGESLYKHGQKITESIKNIFSPASYFEHYGLSYIGPVDGHNIEEITKNLTGAKDLEEPVILHVTTQKGFGDPFAIKNPTLSHGISSSNKKTNKGIQIHKQLEKSLIDIFNNDENTIAVTPAMAFGSGITNLKEKFPTRCIDVGVAEEHAITFSGGLAKGGKKVFSIIYSSFLQRSLDNIFHDVCIQNLPVTICVDRSSLAEYGETHHGIYDISFLMSMPNIVISQPRNAAIFDKLLKYSCKIKKPFVIRYPTIAVKENNATDISLGKGEILKNGKDVAIIALGHMCDTALQIVDTLKKENIDPTIIDPIFLKPFDRELIKNILSSHKNIVILEENSKLGGLTSIIESLIVEFQYGNKLISCSLDDKIIPNGDRESLLRVCKLDNLSIVKKIESFLK